LHAFLPFSMAIFFAVLSLVFLLIPASRNHPQRWSNSLLRAFMLVVSWLVLAVLFIAVFIPGRWFLWGRSLFFRKSSCIAKDSYWSDMEQSSPSRHFETLH